jgi:predicted AAA+ superfamily ATPase
LTTVADLQSHPKLGASWEGFALEQVIGALGTRDAYFWATHGGAELDLLVRVAGKHYGFEFKYVDAPGSSRSMHVAIQELRLEHLWVVYPGHQGYSLDDKISVLPIEAVPGLNLASRI